MELNLKTICNGIFDTHAHYDDEKFDGVREELLEVLPKFGVVGVINAACDLFESAEKTIELTRKYDYFYGAVGLHPECADESEYDEERLTELLKEPKIVAIGEIGLDYYYTSDNREKQIDVVSKQLNLAVRLDKPVVYHDREAHGDTLELLKKYQPRGVVHCFSGSIEMARDILKIGMYIGVGGVVTFNNAKRLVEVVKETPMDRILLETDAPYLSPVPYRGKTNNSAYISSVAEKVAEIKNISVKEVIETARENTKKLYHI